MAKLIVKRDRIVFKKETILENRSLTIKGLKRFLNKRNLKIKEKDLSAAYAAYTGENSPVKVPVITGKRRKGVVSREERIPRNTPVKSLRGDILPKKVSLKERLKAAVKKAKEDGHRFAAVRTAYGLIEVRRRTSFDETYEVFMEVFKEKRAEILAYEKALSEDLSHPHLAKHYIKEFGDKIIPYFKLVDTMALSYGMNPRNVWDSCGVWGISPDLFLFKIGDKEHLHNIKVVKMFVEIALETLRVRGRVDRIPSIFHPSVFFEQRERMKEYKEKIDSNIVYPGIEEYEIFISIFWRLYKKYGVDGIPSLRITQLMNWDETWDELLGWKDEDLLPLTLMLIDSDFYSIDKVKTGEGRRGGYYKINFRKLNNWKKLSKREKAKFLPAPLAWRLLFNRKAPDGIEFRDPNPVNFTRASQRAFRELAEIIKRDDRGYFAANIKAAYHLSLAFGDMNTVKRWLNALGLKVDALGIHDAFVNAHHFLKLKYKEKWAALLIKFPGLRKVTWAFREFEREFGRVATKTEISSYAATKKYRNVKLKDVAEIAAELKLSQREFEDYQNFFLKTPEKKSTMLPNVVVEKGEYKFRKLDDHDKIGPFLGLLTDCCQHLHNAGDTCAKAGWRDPESGFYVVEKDGKIVAQSWAWRGKKGELCFDSIEGLGNVNVNIIAELYKEAARQLVGKMGITRVTVGDTSYGLTEDVKQILGGVNRESAVMIKKVSYTDADDQWLLAD